MRITTAFAGIVLTCTPLLLRAQEQPAEPSLDGALAARLEELKAPGALVGIYRKHTPPQEFAIGLADVENKRPMSVDCHVRIGSVSKLLVGTTFLLVADEYKVSLDEPISMYVPGVRDGDRITLRQIGNHRSGLFNHIESRLVKVMFAKDPAHWFTTDELLEFSLKPKLYFEPGTAHHYANGNTILLTKVIEKLTGNPWPDEVRKRVIEPLKLVHTQIPTDNTLPQPFAEGYALGTDKGPFFNRGDILIRVTETSPSWWGPAGSMISTLGDLGRCTAPLATGQLLSEPMRHELLNWTTTDDTDIEYGFQIQRNHGRIGHDGDVPGYHTYVCYLPEHETTVVAMCNIYGWSTRKEPAKELAMIAIQSVTAPTSATNR